LRGVAAFGEEASGFIKAVVGWGGGKTGRQMDSSVTLADSTPWDEDVPINVVRRLKAKKTLKMKKTLKTKRSPEKKEIPEKNEKKENCGTCGFSMDLRADCIDWERDPCDDCCCGSCGCRKETWGEPCEFCG
jgi:hypothetical protein